MIPAVTAKPAARVTISQPFASAPGVPTLEFDVAATPGFRAGATISQDTARQLINELQAALDEIAVKTDA